FGGRTRQATATNCLSDKYTMYMHCQHFISGFLRAAPAAMAMAAVPLSAQVKVEDSERFAAIGEADLEVEKLAGGMAFTEGPVWLESEKTLVFSDIPASKWMQWSAGEGLRVRGESKAANGNTVDAEGRMISCQHDGRNVIRHEKDGTTKV